MTSLLTALAAGTIRVAPGWDSETLRIMGKKHNARDGDDTIAEAEGPWGRLRISIDGYPVSVRAQIDGETVATLTAVSETRADEGPVPTFTDRDVPLLLGDLQADLRFVAEGSRLRPAGRKRFLRVTAHDRAWTYGSSETQTTTGHAVGKVLGSLNAPTELRRGSDPASGEVVTSWYDSKPTDERHPSGRPYITLSWAEDTTVSEIVLTLLLHLGTNEIKLKPLWTRGVDLAGAF